MVDRFDLDNFDDSLSQERRQRAQQQRRSQQSHSQGTSGGRPVYRDAASARRRREAQRKRRTRNRVIIVGVGILIVVFIILMFSLMIKGCSCSSSGKQPETSSISTDTKQQQQSSAGSAATSSEPAAQPVNQQDLSPSYFKTPVIKDDNTNGELYYAIYVWNKTGYELFGGDDERSKTYANTINTLAAKLPGIKVYDMIIPNHTEFGLPQRLKSGDIT